MRPLLDLNIVLDALLMRDPWRAEAEAIWAVHRAGRIDAAISAASLPTLFYIMRKQADLTRAHLAVKTCLQSLHIIPVDRPTLELARTMTGPDFEDNLQVAYAVVARLDAIVTRDPNGFVGSPVPVLSPAEWLAQFATGNDAP